MIAKLRGILDSTGDGFLILDVGGVGYRVFCSSRTLAKMPAAGKEASVLTETLVREDAIRLIGFADIVEKNQFLLLTGVQGVGTKVALAILSALSGDDVTMALASGDSKAFCRASGVGPKLAARIVSELKGKAGTLIDLSGSSAIDGSVVSGSAGTSETAIGDAVSALTNIGYARLDAASAVSKAAKKIGKDAKVEDLIRTALKELSVL